MNIGLVLSGGMAKGAYQIGALRALNEFVPLNEIKYISCASVGVLNGYAYATNNLDLAENMWRGICENKDTKLLINQVLKSGTLQQNIVNLHQPETSPSQAFYCSLLDLNHRNIVYKDLTSVKSERVPLYLKASVAMPIYNKSVSIGDKAYYDGAMIDNIPVYPLLKHNLDYIICIYFDDICYRFENAYFDNKIIKLTFPCESTLRESITFKKESIEKMIKNGYERTKQILESVFEEGYKNIDHIYNTIENMNKSNKNYSLRITGDVLVTNLNKITQRLTKKSVL